MTWIFRVGDWHSVQFRALRAKLGDIGSDALRVQRVSSTSFDNSQLKPMNPAIDLLLKRRSVPPRLLGPPAPTPREVDTMLTIASRVPDHGRAVPWRFIIIGPAGGARLGELIAATFLVDHPDANAATMDAERARLVRAPLVIAVVSCPHEHPKAPEWEQTLSAGAAAMNLVIAANALGYSTNWHTEWYAYDDRITSELGLGAEERIAGFVHIGTAVEPPLDRPRPELSEIVSRYVSTGIEPYHPADGDQS